MSVENTEGNSQQEGEPEPGQAILVVGSEDSFSELLIDYALGIAGRMGYSIVALNLLEANGRELRRYGSEKYAEELNRVQQAAQESAREFGKKAWANKAGFKSEWAMGELDQKAREIYEREGNIHLVLVEPEYMGESDEANRSIPTFIYSE